MRKGNNDLEALGLNEHRLAGQVEMENKNTALTETAVPADTEGGNAAMTTA